MQGTQVELDQVILGILIQEPRSAISPLWSVVPTPVSLCTGPWLLASCILLFM